MNKTTMMSSKVLRKSLPVMLPSRFNQTSVNKEKLDESIGEEDETEGDVRRSHQQVVNWRQFRPELHRKNYFKGATSLIIGKEGSLNLTDEAAREVVKDAFKIAGHEMPEQSLEDRIRENAKGVVAFEEFKTLNESESDVEFTSEKENEPTSRIPSKMSVHQTSQAQGGATSRAQLIDRSIANNSNLVKIMD